MRVRRYATMAMIVLLLLGTLCYLGYGDYTESQTNIIEAEEQYKKDKHQLISTIYYSLKRDAKNRTDTVKSNIKNSILSEYNNDWDRYGIDYNDPKNSALVDITSKAISTPQTQHMYVTSDANDMFILTSWGILSDYSKDCSVVPPGNTDSYRLLAGEYDKHFNKILAKQAIDSITRGKDIDIYWQFSNSLKLKTPAIITMNIENLFNVDDLESIRDIECLVYSSIDDNSDITGIEDVSPTGIIQNNKKLYIVQGFNLYEQIKKNYMSSFKELDNTYEKKLITLNAEKSSRSIKLILLFVVMIYTFISMSTLQNVCVRGADKVGGNTH